LWLVQVSVFNEKFLESWLRPQEKVPLTISRLVQPAATQSHLNARAERVQRSIRHQPSSGVNRSRHAAANYQQGAGCKPAARRAMQKTPPKAAKGVCF